MPATLSPHAPLLSDRTQAAMHAAVVANPDDVTARLVLADRWEELGRLDVAAMWRGTLPERKKTRARIDALTDAERKAMPAWARKWIAIGLSTEPADRPLFEAAATQCYLAAGLNPPRFVWCPSPLVAAIAGSRYALIRSGKRKGGAVGVAVHGAVHGAVRNAVRDAVDGAVDGAEIRNLYWRYMGGQFWVGGYWWGSPAFVGFFLDRLKLKIADHLELAARAYAATASSACWWWPHREVVFVSERPHTLTVKSGQTPHVAWEGWEVGQP